MKATFTKANRLISYPFANGQMTHSESNEEKLFNFKEFTVPTPMTEQEIAPPLHVWDRISNILDEQDRKKMLIEHAETIAFKATPEPRRLVFISLAAIFTACIVWYFL